MESISSAARRSSSMTSRSGRVTLRPGHKYEPSRRRLEPENSAEAMSGQTPPPGRSEPTTWRFRSRVESEPSSASERSSRASPMFGQGSQHAELSQDTELHLRFASPRNLEHIFKRTAELRNFMSLAVGRPITVLSVTGYRDDFADRTKLPCPIEILWGIPHNPNPPTKPARRTKCSSPSMPSRPPSRR